MEGVIQCGRLTIREEAIKGLTWVEAKEKFPNIKESLLKGAYDLANPKKVQKKKEEAE